MGTVAYSFLWVLQAVYHQPYQGVGFRFKAPGSELRIRV